MHSCFDDARRTIIAICCYYDIATILGFGWLAFLVTADAVISPSGTGNIFMSTSSRVVFGWARNGTLPGVVAHARAVDLLDVAVSLLERPGHRRLLGAHLHLRRCPDFGVRAAAQRPGDA